MTSGLLKGSAGTARQTFVMTVAAPNTIRIVPFHLGGKMFAISPAEYGTAASMVISHPKPSATFNQSMVITVFN